MSEIFITSDFHFMHNRDFIYGPRGFKNVQEAAETLVENYNKVVNDKDIVYVLGDCMLNDDDMGLKYLRQLKGHKFLAIGNHDSDTRIYKYMKANIFNSIQFGYRMKWGKWTYLLSHYPILTENYQDKHKVISLCGHTHTNDPFSDWDKGIIYHCEVDAHNGYPINIRTIEQNIKLKILQNS